MKILISLLVGSIAWQTNSMQSLEKRRRVGSCTASIIELNMHSQRPTTQFCSSGGLGSIRQSASLVFPLSLSLSFFLFLSLSLSQAHTHSNLSTPFISFTLSHSLSLPICKKRLKVDQDSWILNGFNGKKWTRVTKVGQR